MYADFVLAFEAGRLLEAAAQRSRQGGEGGEGGGGREGTGGAWGRGGGERRQRQWLFW